MKRSEMLQLLYGKLSKEYLIKKESIYNSTENILNFLEQNGMQPPPIRVFKESTILNYETGKWETGKISCTVNEWEPEGEDGKQR